MRFGIVILPQTDWPEAARSWRAAEALGFDHAWTYDHLSWRSLAGERWHATIPTLTAAAMVTERIGLGTFVASPNYRHPVPFAKEAATLDQISGGRLLLGIGSGGTGFDSHVLGQPELSPRERFDRFEEFAEALDRLLRFEEGPDGDGISIAGRWYTAVGARMVGAPPQRPRTPLLVAANGRRGRGLAVRLGDGWITTASAAAPADGDRWAGLGELVARLDEECAAVGREPGTLDRVLSFDDEQHLALSSVDAFEDAAGRAAELGFTDLVVHWPRAEGVYAGSEAVLEEAASRLDSLRAR